MLLMMTGTLCSDALPCSLGEGPVHCLFIPAESTVQLSISQPDTVEAVHSSRLLFDCLEAPPAAHDNAHYIVIRPDGAYTARSLPSRHFNLLQYSRNFGERMHTPAAMRRIECMCQLPLTCQHYGACAAQIPCLTM